jgi:phage gp36-like protein
MTYCTVQDLIDRVGTPRLAQRTDRINKPATTVDTSLVEKHISDAASLIDGYLAKKVSLPLSPVPAVLTKIALDLSWYYILGDAVAKDSPEASAYKDAIRWLQDVAKGLVVLEVAGVEAPSAGDGQIRVKAPSRVFSRDSMGGY